MHRTNLFLAEKQITALKAMAQKTGLTYSELIRRAIDEYLKRHRKDA